MYISTISHTHTHTRPFNGPFSGTTQVSRYQKVKPIWILLKQETVSGSGISWAICKSASCSRQTTTPAPHPSVFYRPDALPATQPTASKHWRHYFMATVQLYYYGMHTGPADCYSGVQTPYKTAAACLKALIWQQAVSRQCSAFLKGTDTACIKICWE